MAIHHRRTVRKISRFLKRSVILVLKWYRYFISPLLGSRCRFFPSCSEYAMLAVKRHGILIGSYLALKRILCCHPFHKGGYDPVPKRVFLKKKSREF